MLQQQIQVKSCLQIHMLTYFSLYDIKIIHQKTSGSSKSKDKMSVNQEFLAECGANVKIFHCIWYIFPSGGARGESADHPGHQKWFNHVCQIPCKHCDCCLDTYFSYSHKWRPHSGSREKVHRLYLMLFWSTLQFCFGSYHFNTVVVMFRHTHPSYQI